MAVDPRVWGRDCQVSLSNLDFVRSPQAGLAEIEGAANVQGAVLRRLDTPLGDLPAHPEYGCRAWDLLGEPLILGFGDQFLAAVREALALEPRITVTALRIAIVQPQARVDVGISYMLIGEPGVRNFVWSVQLAATRASIPP